MNSFEKVRKREEIFRRSKNIYNALQDEESREIFANRIMLNITGDWKYASNIVKKYLRGYGKEEIFLGVDACLEQKKLNKDSEYIIYGAGMYGSIVHRYLTNNNYVVKAFCDADIKKQATEYCNLKVMSPECAAKDSESKIIMAVWNQSIVIRERMKEFGIDEERIIDSFIDENYIDKNQYFDADIIKFENEEVFLDCGCYDFETTEIFMRKCLNYKKIYCFEPAAQNYTNIKKYIQDRKIEKAELLPYGVWDKQETLFFHENGSSGQIDANGEMKIECIAIDEFIRDKVTFIKMDIEGAELNALMGARKTIVENRPKLAISVYHKSDDIIEIPEYILSLVPDYKLYLRHYSNYYATETVLYAV